MLSRNLNVLLVLCGVCLFLTLGLFVQFYNLYGIPFGKRDVDGYVKHLSQPLDEYRDDEHISIEIAREMGFVRVDLRHTFFQLFVRLVAWWVKLEPVKVLVYLIPFMLWVVIPLSLLFLCYCFLGVWDGFPVLLVLFGGYTLILFGLVSVWSQMFSYVCFLLCIGFLKLFFDKKIDVVPSVFFGVVSVLFHPFTLPLYLLLGVAYFLNNRNRKEVFVFVFLVFLLANVSMFFTRNQIFWNYTIFHNLNYPEPTIYFILYNLTNPILWVLFAVGFLRGREWNIFDYYVLLVVFVGLFVHNARGLVFAHPFLCIYAYLGFRYLQAKMNHPKLLTVILCVFIYFHFSTLFSGYVFDMMLEMDGSEYFCEVRGLASEPLKRLLNIEN